MIGSGELGGGGAAQALGGVLGALCSPLGGGTSGGCSTSADLMDWLALEPATGGEVF